MNSVSVLVPDYLEQFHCKCGECRHPCCDGWGISVGEKEYYTLLGISCSSRLRHKLDDAFVISPMPTEEAYASISPNYLEQCPMLDEDGLCLLQKEKGEDILPTVCRMYPRAVKKYGDRHELSLSCSCEATVEQLMKSTAPLTLREIRTELAFDGISVYGDDPARDRLRYDLIFTMSDSSISVPERLTRICELCCGKTPDTFGSREDALRSLRTLLEILCRHSESMRICGEKALGFLSSGNDENPVGLFDAAEDHLYGLIPSIEAYAGRIISNHMLYESFPYVPGCDSPDTAFAAFCTAVALLKVLCVCGMSDSDRMEDFVDILAFANRFIEHTDFYRLCSHISHPEGAGTLSRFAPLLRREE